MKDSILTIRVSEEQKLKLEEYSYENNISISEIIRNIIDNELSEPEVIYLGDGRWYNEAIDKPLLQSFNLTSLIYWILDKYSFPEADESVDYYYELLDTIEQINRSRLFKNEFLIELDKVKEELQLYLKDSSCYKLTFPHRTDGFDYEELRMAIHTIKFNSDNEKVINLK